MAENPCSIFGNRHGYGGNLIVYFSRVRPSVQDSPAQYVGHDDKEFHGGKIRREEGKIC